MATGLTTDQAERRRAVRRAWTAICLTPVGAFAGLMIMWVLWVGFTDAYLEDMATAQFAAVFLPGVAVAMAPPAAGIALGLPAARAGSRWAMAAVVVAGVLLLAIGAGAVRAILFPASPS